MTSEQTSIYEKQKVTNASLLLCAVMAVSIYPQRAFAEIKVREFLVEPKQSKSQVPEVTRQGTFLRPQSISALEISSDDHVITVGTMAFSNESNVWQYSSEGDALAARYFPPSGPMQVATLSGGRAMAIGLGFSRVTSPDPTVWLGSTSQLFAPKLDDQLSASDSADGQFARLRPGSGANWLFKPPRLMMAEDGNRRELRSEDDNLFPTSRAMRIAASADGKRLAFGWLVFNQATPHLPQTKESIEVWAVNPNRKLWTSRAVNDSPPNIPDPRKNFPELAKVFALDSEQFVPGHVAASVALNRDGSRVAIVEYGVQGRLRPGAAIGKWDPPITS